MPSDALSSALGDRTRFDDALRLQLAELTATGTGAERELCWVDPDFFAWPLSDPALLDSVTRFLRAPGRQLTLVALRFDALEARHPGFARWRRDWAHAVPAFSPGAAMDLPSLSLAARSVVEVLDRESFRGLATREVRAVMQARERLSELLRRCEPAWPATTLGL